MVLAGKTALVTGAGRGIGSAICQKLSDLGASVIINYAGNDEAASQTQAKCPGSEIFRADVSKMPECQALFEFCQSKFDTPDILINNAGITRDNLLMRMSEEDFDRVLEVNLKGAFNCTKLASRSMLRKRGGRIVNIASIAGQMGNAGQVNYAASKAGLIGMTKSLALELSSRGITVNAVAPGFISTDMTNALPEEVKAQMLKSIPAARFGKAMEIADTVAFLCSESAAYITGQVIAVNGGMYL